MIPMAGEGLQPEFGGGWAKGKLKIQNKRLQKAYLFSKEVVSGWFGRGGGGGHRCSWLGPGIDDQKG